MRWAEICRSARVIAGSAGAALTAVPYTCRSRLSAAATDAAAPSISAAGSSQRRAPAALAVSRNVDVAIPIPLDPHRHLAVGDGLGAHIAAGAVVDLLIRSLVDTQHHDQPASHFHLAAGQTLAVEEQLLALARAQQMTMDTVSGIAGAELVGRIEQLDVLPGGQQLVERHVQVHVLLVDLEIQPAGEQSTQLQRTAQRLGHESDTVVALQIAADEARRRRPGRIAAIGEIHRLASEGRARAL